MGVGRRIGDTLRVPGRGARRAIAVITVLVLAAALGGAVALSAPSLVASLGLARQVAPSTLLPGSSSL